MPRGKPTFALDLPRPTLSARGATKQQVAYETLRDAILHKRLAAASRLPSTRTLAERWGVARGTLELVYERLAGEGYVVRSSGSGTTVSAVIPDVFIAVPATAPLKLNPVRVEDGHQDSGVEAGVAFVARLPDPALMPAPQWARLITRGLARHGLASVPVQGLLALREQVAGYLGSHRGIRCSAEDVVITTGIRHALDLLARTVLQPGDKACVEDPGYPSAAKLFKLAGATLAYIPVGPEGINERELARHSDARLVYVTPAHQSPLGVTLSVSRRLALLDWARRKGAWVVEDDYDSEFNYTRAPLAALKALDEDERVIYCGSFNKTLFAGLRVGYMLVPQALRKPILERLEVTGRSVGLTEQVALAEWLASGAFVRHLRQARQTYLLRRDALIDGLNQHAPGRFKLQGTHAGLHCVLQLPEGVDAQAFCRRAAELGLRLQPVSQFCHQAHHPGAVVLGYTALTLAQIKYHARQLAQL